MRILEIKGKTQIQRTEAFIRVLISAKEDYLSEKPEVYTWELQEWGVNEPYMSSGSAERHARTLRKQGILEHPIENGMVNKHAYIMAEQYPSIPSHAEELQEERYCEIADLQIKGLLKTKSLF